MAVLAAAVVVVTAVVVSYAQTPVYQATAQLLITPTVSTSSVLNQSGAAASPSVQDVQTQMHLITSRPVEDIVKSVLGTSPPVSVSEIGQTTVVQVRASSTIAGRAAQVANAYANAYLSSQRAQAINNLQAAGTQIQSKIDDLQKQIDTLNARVAAAPTKEQAALLANVGSQRDNLVTQQGLLQAAVGPTSAQRLGCHKRRPGRHARHHADRAGVTTAEAQCHLGPRRWVVVRSRGVLHTRLPRRFGAITRRRRPSNPRPVRPGPHPTDRRVEDFRRPKNHLTRGAEVSGGRGLPDPANVHSVRRSRSPSADHPTDQRRCRRRQDDDTGQPRSRIGQCGRPSLHGLLRSTKAENP